MWMKNKVYIEVNTRHLVIEINEKLLLNDYTKLLKYGINFVLIYTSRFSFFLLLLDTRSEWFVSSVRNSEFCQHFQSANPHALTHHVQTKENKWYRSVSQHEYPRNRRWLVRGYCTRNECVCIDGSLVDVSMIRHCNVPSFRTHEIALLTLTSVAAPIHAQAHLVVPRLPPTHATPPSVNSAGNTNCKLSSAVDACRLRTRIKRGDGI